MSEYARLRSDYDGQDEADHTKGDSVLHLPLAGGEPTTTRANSAASRIFSMKTGVIVLVIVNLLVWGFAARRLRYVASVFDEALAEQRIETRALPRPDPLDGLLGFLEAKRAVGGK
ncbi:hypothetical protein C2E23DRAFT_885738 [Lenzites betulinus]|nr:hypothetical protein C2E23DRAFT_885738 [Lenzites betulinus]